jgi:hypothetical protein
MAMVAAVMAVVVEETAAWVATAKATLERRR